MFLFVQSKKTVRHLKFANKLEDMIKAYSNFIQFQDEKTLLITDMPHMKNKDAVAVWMAGHSTYPSEKDIKQALEESVFEHFGSRFRFQTSTGNWLVETDPIGAFSPILLTTNDGVFIADGHDILLKLGVVECEENPDWMADILISGYPHDGENMLSSFERIPACEKIIGGNGGISQKVHTDFTHSLHEPLSLEESVNVSRNVFSDVFSSLPKDGIGMHLTGGYDSRLLLSALLRSGFNPKTFVFGIQKNYNSNISIKLSNTLNLEHNFITLDRQFISVAWVFLSDIKKSR